MAVPEASSVMVWFGPLLTVYVMIAFGVPVNVIVAVCSEQIVVLPVMAIEAVGNAKTVITTVPLTGCVQIAPVNVTLTKVKVVVTVYVFVMVAVPEAFNTMVWFGPLLIVYVTTAFGVPVNVTVADCPGQIVVFALMLAAGAGTTVIVTVPLTGWIQPEIAALTNV